MQGDAFELALKGVMERESASERRVAAMASVAALPEC